MNQFRNSRDLGTLRSRGTSGSQTARQFSTALPMDAGCVDAIQKKTLRSNKRACDAAAGQLGTARNSRPNSSGGLRVLAEENGNIIKMETVDAKKKLVMVSDSPMSTSIQQAPLQINTSRVGVASQQPCKDHVVGESDSIPHFCTALIDRVRDLNIDDGPPSTRSYRLDPYAITANEETRPCPEGRQLILTRPEHWTEKNGGSMGNDVGLDEEKKVQNSLPLEMKRSVEQEKTYQRVMRSFLLSESAGCYAEYEDDIVSYCKRTEDYALPQKRKYMLSMKYISYEQRDTLINWVAEIHTKWKLSQETLFLTVSFMDRFMAMKPAVMTTQYMQMMGAISLNICSKFEDLIPFSLRDVSDLRPRWGQADIVEFESMLISDMKFRVTVPTSLFFLKHYIRVASGADQTFDDREAILAQYLATLALYCCEIVSDYKPSIVAAIALYLARQRLSANPLWTEALERASGFSPSAPETYTAMKMLHDFWRSVSKDFRRIAASTFNKFADKAYLRVALMDTYRPNKKRRL
eukprot:GEMP01006484.1.p1 GENE.GEMP01006484.1~~GEMP01006484.1.p1  ORF type:complete len:522 (+),score=69.23 GEMP01006484.1:102-1667(+)